MAVSQTSWGKARAVITAITNTTITTANLQANSTDVVDGFVVSKIYWTTANTTAGVKLARGSNTIFVGCGTGNWDLDNVAINISDYPAANLVITIPDAVSTCIVEVMKRPGSA